MFFDIAKNGNNLKGVGKTSFYRKFMRIFPNCSRFKQPRSDLWRLALVNLIPISNLIGGGSISSFYCVEFIVTFSNYKADYESII